MATGAEMQTFPADGPPDPNGGWSTAIQTLPGAIVFPPEISSMRQPAGVVTAEGDYFRLGATWRGRAPITLAPETEPGKVAELPGRWLWAGVLWAHFGHFLAESTARLWALDAIREQVDGLLYIPKRPRMGDEIKPMHTIFMECLGVDLPLHVVTEPTRVQSLVVPGQGFGLGQIAQGTPEFRDFIHTRFGAQIPAEGPEKLYISRSALGLRKGGLLGETVLEEKLAAQGYEIFHPQKHSMPVQIARYKAAKKVIAADGSALHLFAMVGRPDQDVAVVLRRTSNVADNLIRHLEHFCGRKPRVIQTLRREWVPEHKQRSSRLSFGELHLARLQRRLIRFGFIEPRDHWSPLSDEERNKIFEEKGLIGDKAYIEGPGGKSGDTAPKHAAE